MFTVTPFLGVVILAYAVVAFTSGIFGNPPGSMDTFLQSSLFGLGLPSTETWTFRVSDIFTTLGLVALAIESIKSSRTNRLSIANHGLSLVVFVVAVVLFIVVKGFGTTAFFLLCIMCFMDVLVGTVVTIVTARRDIGVDQGAFYGGDR
jgi:hypothetical protein